MGFDPAGNRLNPAMPLYQFSREDMADLTAYIKRLETALDPGLTETEIHVGVVLPPHERMPDIADAIRLVLSAYFDRVNGAGGIFDRRVIPQFAESNAASGWPRTFALVASYIAGSEREAATFAAINRLPLIGALTLYPQIDSPVNPYVFYLDEGLPGECEALVRYALKHFGGRPARAAIVSSSDQISKDMAALVRASLLEKGWTLSGEDPASVTRVSADVIFFLAPGASLPDLTGSQAKFLLPGSIAPPEVFDKSAKWGGRLVMAFSSLPTDPSPQGMAEYGTLADEYKLSPARKQWQLRALACAKLLVEGLRRSGREVTRQKLVETIEGLQKYDTGFSPALTYGPNRRIGSMSARIVVDDAPR
jgi:hypothetical protein